MQDVGCFQVLNLRVEAGVHCTVFNTVVTASGMTYLNSRSLGKLKRPSKISRLFASERWGAHVHIVRHTSQNSYVIFQEWGNENAQASTQIVCASCEHNLKCTSRAQLRKLACVLFAFLREEEKRLFGSSRGRIRYGRHVHPRLRLPRPHK